MKYLKIICITLSGVGKTPEAPRYNIITILKIMLLRFDRCCDILSITIKYIEIYYNLLPFFNCKLLYVPKGKLCQHVLSNKIKLSVSSSNCCHFYCSKMYLEDWKKYYCSRLPNVSFVFVILIVYIIKYRYLASVWRCEIATQNIAILQCQFFYHP